MRWWADLAIATLALVGLWVTLAKAAAGVVRVWAWLRRDRVSPLLEDEPSYCECCEALGFEAYAVLDGGYCRGCGHWHGELELPPERSAADLGFTGELIRMPRLGTPIDPLRGPINFLERLEARRERLASAAELEHRAAYEVMGLEFPSGLLARVREAAQ